MPGFFPDEQTTDQKLDLILKEITEMALDLTALTAQVQANTAVEASAVTLIQAIAAELSASTGDPAAIAALAAQLNSSAQALASAIAANTPASGVATPVPTATPAKKKP